MAIMIMIMTIGCSVGVMQAHLGILKRALIGWRSDRGGSPSPSSMAVMPSDQTSQRAS